MTKLALAKETPEVERTYEVVGSAPEEGCIFRRVETRMNGCFKKAVREKYNSETGDWEEYQIEQPDRSQIEDLISDVKERIQTAALDIEVLSKMIKKMHLSDHKEYLDQDGLQFIGRLLKQKADLILNEGNKLDELVSNLNAEK